MPLKTPLASWDAPRQAAYRAQHQGALPAFHVLLDASTSMVPYTRSLGKAFTAHMQWLKTHAAPLSTIEVTVFGKTIARMPAQTLATAALRLPEAYEPHGGTPLYDVVGACLAMQIPGQHILIVLTDGEDSTSEEWTAPRLSLRMQQAQADQGWLCVFLGAYPDALATGLAMGFHEGNCLVFGTSDFPAAFAMLERGMARYLATPVAARKALANGGIF